MVSYEELSSVFDMDNPLTLEYFEICNTKDDEGFYIEGHHMLPKCIWPKYEDSGWNIVNLIYKRHFRAHEILAQICLQKRHQFQMLKAWNMMSGRNGVVPDPETYDKLKRLHRDFQSERSSGSNNPMYGKPCSPERKAKISYARKGKRRISDEEMVRRQSEKERQKPARRVAYTHEKKTSFVEFLKQNTNLTLVGEYINTDSYVSFQCDRGHPVFHRRPVDVERGWHCPACRKEDFDAYATRRVTQNDFEQYLKDNTNLTLVRGFVDMGTKCWFRCDCGHPEFEQEPSDIKRGIVCRQCKKKTRKKNIPVSAEHRANLSKAGRRPPEEFLNYLQQNTNLHMVSEYVRMQERAWFQCDRGHEPFFKTPTQVKAGEVCKHCNREDRLAKKELNDKT